jgi:alkylation response protein AidB-like acyl-CoA dehydrogenase
MAAMLAIHRPTRYAAERYGMRRARRHGGRHGQTPGIARGDRRQREIRSAPGRELEKIGLQAQDTAELFFNDARVAAANLLGEKGRGLQYLMSHLPRERLGVTANAMATTEAMFEITVDYCRQRTAFGKPLTALQHIRFELAEMATEIDIAQAYVDKSVLAFNAGKLTDIDAAKGKWYLSELQKRVLDRACSYTADTAT